MSVRLIQDTEATPITLPKEFAWCLVGAGSLVIMYILTMYFFTMRLRIGSMRRRFLRDFDEKHAKAFPGSKTTPEFGYPDSGNGYFGKRLPYADWYRMNNGQRAQINYLEQLHFILISTLVAGVCHPTWAFRLQMGYLFGRVLFAIGYTKAGPNARVPGALLMDICMLGCIYFAGKSVYDLV